MRRYLLVAGVLLLLAGLLWPWLGQGRLWRWFGHLPGDIRFERHGLFFHFPLVSCLVISVVLCMVLLLFRRAIQ